jgi:RNA polymerase sigma factor (sigma-70 family)
VDDNDTKIPEHYAVEVRQFFVAHVRWLFRHAYLRTYDREHAADLVQDTFEAATLSWATLRELAEAQQRAWLQTTLAHKETSNYRRRMTLRRREPELHHRYRTAEANTEQQALSAIALERAAEIIEGLPGNQKRIALMKWNNRMKGSEIAAALGCAEGTVAAQIHAIRRKLIEGLGPYYPFAEDNREGGGS